MKAYLQSTNGEEIELNITQPEPSDGEMFDKCVQLSEEALEKMRCWKEEGYWWIRIVG